MFALAIPALLKLVGIALGLINHPAAKVAADAITGVQDAIDRNEIKPEDMQQANDHLEKMRQIDADQETAEQAQDALTARAEIVSEDKFVRRMRPTWGYAMAMAWVSQFGASSYLIVANPALAIQLITAMGTLMPLWGVALAVLGIHFYGRTQEKKAELLGNPDAIKTVGQTIADGAGATWDVVTGKVARK